jgi:hypothetical protein
MLEQHAELLAANLPATVDGHTQLRRLLGADAALDAASIRLLALHATQPAVPIADLLFQHDTPIQALLRYLRLLWETSWPPAAEVLLVEHVRYAAPEGQDKLAPWLAVPAEQLAVYLYARRFLAQHRVHGIVNHLRGLGILAFDPEPLEEWIEAVLARWDRLPAWRQRIITVAENALSSDDLRRLVGILPRDETTLWAAIQTAETPGLFAQLVLRLLGSIPDSNLDAFMQSWPQHRPSLLSALPATPTGNAAATLADLQDTAGNVLAILARGLPSANDLATLIDWYVDGGAHVLEYACARAADATRKLATADDRERLTIYVQTLRQRVRELLDQADRILAGTIGADYSGYLTHDRVATKLIAGLLGRRRTREESGSSVWIVIFDGMRWDTWQHVVKPKLRQHFEFVRSPEKAFLSLLPSWTRIARTSLLAGRQPKDWRAPDNRWSYDQKLLVARLLTLAPADVERKLQFYSGMEADTTYRQLSVNDRYPWNVLVFNISDDGLHMERGDLVQLNAKIAVQMDNVLQTLTLHVQPTDLVIVSSDHGFMELDEADGIPIEDDARWSRELEAGDHPVRYRYLLGLHRPEGFAVTHPNHRPPEFTVAVGRRWFRRTDDRRKPDRYAHGGLSLAEMVVPGALLRRITAPTVKVSLEGLPSSLEVTEDDPVVVPITIANSGNQRGTYRLSARLATDLQTQEFVGALDPGSQQTITFRSSARYQKRAGGHSHLELTFSYQDVDETWKPPRRQQIPLTVVPRTDVVEIEFGGLDDLDNL